MKPRNVTLVIFFLALAVVPGLAQQQFWYDNGPINGNVTAYQINFGSMVSDSFYLVSAYCGQYCGVVSFTFGVWEYPGDVMTSLQWSYSSGYLGSGHVYGSGTASGSYLYDSFISNNQYGYSVHQITATADAGGMETYRYYALNLWNATTSGGYPVYWDENSGIGCMSLGCPSSAWGYFPQLQGAATTVTVGPVASEAFTIYFVGCSDDKGSDGSCSPQTPRRP